MRKQIKCKTEYYEKSNPPHRHPGFGRKPTLRGPSLPFDGARGGRTGQRRRICDGRAAERRRAGGGPDDRRPGTVRTESRTGQLHAANSVPRVRPRDESGARGGGQRSGRIRDAGLGHRHRERGGEGSAGAARGGPLRGRCGQRPGGHRQGRHRTARTGARRLDRRREDLDQRQKRLESLRQRPGAAHGARTAADLPAVAPGRGDSENRGRARDGRRLRCRLGGRRDPHHAQKAPRERHRRLGGVQHDAVGHHRPPQSLGQHQRPLGPRGPLRLGVGIFRERQNDHRRANALQCGGQVAQRPFGDEGPHPQLRGQRRDGRRDRPAAQRRRGVRILAQPRRRAQRHLHRFPDGGRDGPHEEPVRQPQPQGQLFGDVQLHLEDRHAGLDAQAAGRLHAPRNRHPERQREPHHGPPETSSTRSTATTPRASTTSPRRRWPSKSTFRPAGR